MRSSNPVFSREGTFTRSTGYAGFNTPQPSYAANPYAQQSPYGDRLTDEQLAAMYHAPAAGPLQTGRMTMDDVVARTAITLLVLVATGALTWIAMPMRNFGFAGGAAFAAFVVGLVISFKRKVSPPLILLYAGLEGVFLGAVSKVLNTVFPGIAIEAVLGTTAVFAATLIAYRSGRLRVTPKYQRIGLAIAMGFVILMAVNAIAFAFGADLGLRSGPLGIVVGLVGIALGAFFLTLDFNEIERGIRGGAPEQESWVAAFGLTLSLVWIYLELLRLLSILRGDD